MPRTTVGQYWRHLEPGHFDAAVYGKLETLRVRSIELRREFDDAIKQLRPIRRDDFKGE